MIEKIEMKFKLEQWVKVIELTADSGIVKKDNTKMNYDNYASNFQEKKITKKETKDCFKKKGYRNINNMS
jgi:hypothetical protein